jgi:peptidoglycan/xylan/chitin deacetylase (PgdA/CDA1 family)
MMELANLRQACRGLAIGALSLRKIKAKISPGIRIVCYHDVPAEDAGNLEAQILSMGKRGDFISLDRAIDLIGMQAPFDRPLFVVMFDDGLESTYRNAWPMLERLGVPFSMSVVTSFVGKPRHIGWDGIGEMARSPLVTIGSHSVNHRNFSQLSESQVRCELVESKARIESALAMACHHFCCPWGRPERDFLPERDPRLAVEAGYRSFLTTERGVNRTGDELPVVKRDVLHMHSTAAELRHFLF